MAALERPTGPSGGAASYVVLRTPSALDGFDVPLELEVDSVLDRPPPFFAGVPIPPLEVEIAA